MPIILLGGIVLSLILNPGLARVLFWTSKPNCIGRKENEPGSSFNCKHRNAAVLVENPSHVEEQTCRESSGLTFSLLSSKSKHSRPNLLKIKCISEVARIGSIIVFHLSKVWKSQVLLTVWCNISGEAAGEIWHWSLLGVKGFILD